MTLFLSPEDEGLLGGRFGPAAAFAMDLLWQTGKALGAERFISVSQAHVDGCLYHGQVSLDFVDHLLRLGGRVRVPTTLNVGSMDLIHPELFRGTADLAADGRRLMEAHEALGCVASFTCAPYQTLFRPAFGDQIAWAESNAIVFANSVIGARTARYGDFIDLAAALTGRVPDVGLHRTENRRGRILFRVEPAATRRSADVLAVAIGYLVGERSGEAVPVIDGLPSTMREDHLKALGAVAASSGAVAMFHAVGLTPEAPDVAAALGGRDPEMTFVVSDAMVSDALGRLSTVPEGAALSAVALGTPHFSLSEFTALMPLLDGYSPAAGVDVYVNTSRETLGRLRDRGWDVLLETARVTLVIDTCTYVTSVMREVCGAVMTNSGKWAHYAPNNLGVDVAFGSLEECVASAAQGRVTRLGRR